MGLFLYKIGQCLLKLLDHSISIIEEKQHDIRSHGCLSSDLMIFDAMSSVASLRSFISCPSFSNSKWRNQHAVDCLPINQSIERLLKALTKLYEEYCNCKVNFQSDKSVTDLTDSDTGIKDFHSLDNNKSRIMDMELDVTGDFEEVGVGGKKTATGLSFSSVNWRLNAISLISSFFSVLPVLTWEILFKLMEKEINPQVIALIFFT